MWLYFSAKNLSHSEGNWLCDYTFRPKIYPILREPNYVIILSSQKSIPFWGDLTMWLLFQPKKYPILKKHVYVIMISSQKSIPIWGDLIRWLYPKEWNLSHSEGTWLCDYTFQPKIYPILRGPDYVIIHSSQKSIPFSGDLTIWLYPKEWILSHSEETWLCDYTFQPKIYPILRGPDYVIILSSQKSIQFWGDLTMSLCPKEWNR